MFARRNLTPALCTLTAILAATHVMFRYLDWLANGAPVR
jgi:hypothetical protein